MIRLLRRRPTPPPLSPAFVRELVVVAVGVGLGAILSAVVFLFYAEPLSISENRGRTEFNRLRLERNEADTKELRTDLREVRGELRRLWDLVRTHRH